MIIYLLYVEGANEKLLRILRSHKIRSTFQTENTLHKLRCKPKDRVATEDKNNIDYQIDCSKCEAVSFGESKQALKLRSDQHKISARNCNCERNQIPKHCWEADINFSWDQKKVIDRENRLIPTKIKETILFLKNTNYINKISYMLPKIWLPNLQQFLVTYLCHTHRFQLITLTETHHFFVRKVLMSNYGNLSTYLNQSHCVTSSYP